MDAAPLGLEENFTKTTKIPLLTELEFTSAAGV
jgi:hypothetical protein